MEGKVRCQYEKEVAVVTGGNRGIGLEICRQLAANGVMVVLTARDEKKGTEAVKTLGAHGLSHVVFHQLEVNNAGIVGTTTEISDPESFQQELAGMVGMEKLEWIRKHTTEPYEKAEECLRTNYHGTKIVTEELLPLLQSSSHGRIVNISSYFGLLRRNFKRSSTTLITYPKRDWMSYQNCSSRTTRMVNWNPMDGLLKEGTLHTKRPRLLPMLIRESLQRSTQSYA
ncbi:hypothetical protein PVAP13_1KG410100 [Panicum virgatum]|uniref:(+)-neomenthol dehydrogenase n=1 Tax=Panicum virgatum TaxID=38727 RepID=A0A8T0XPY6_PANVG|nr:hypothetical protein PVAP13_1KG410100 [Panicum virgatum]